MPQLSTEPGLVLEVVVGLGSNLGAREALLAGAARALEALLGLERVAGRERRQKWGPRTLDLDVLWASVPCTTAALRVPHPELEQRWFALQPLLEVAPELGPRYASALRALGGPRPPVAPAVGPRPTWCGFADPG
jgi:7,8-dihydro-6-hydroxymethylpterin-pyrophosphokinase